MVPSFVHPAQPFEAVDPIPEPDAVQEPPTAAPTFVNTGYRVPPRVMSLNCRSLKADTVDFIHALARRDDIPDVICLQEIWQPSPVLLAHLSTHYAVFHQTRQNGEQGGGVAILVRRDCFAASDLWHSRPADAAEGIAVLVQRISDSTCFAIASVYWPPEKPREVEISAANILSHLTDHATLRNSRGEPVKLDIIARDFSAVHPTWSPSKEVC